MLPNGVATLDTAYVLTSVSFAIVLCRIVLRRLKREKFQPDDYLMLAASVLYFMNTAIYPVVVINGNSTSVRDPRKLSPKQIQQIILGSKFVLLGRFFYMSYVWCLKACILIYYTRLTSRTKELLMVKIFAIILGFTWLMCILTIFLECRPFKLYWQVLPKAPQCAKAVEFVIVMGSTNIATDLIIMLLPLPIIIRAKLPLRRKIEIAAIFLVGIFVIFVSIMRIVIVLANLTQQNKLMWGQLECFSATIVANAPILHGLYRHGRSRLRFRSQTSRNEASAVASTGKTRTHNAEESAGTAVNDLENGPGGGFNGGGYALARISKTRKNWEKLDDDNKWQDPQRLDIERQIEISQESSPKSQHDEPERGLAKSKCFAGLGTRELAEINTEISHGDRKDERCGI